jgi:hypothetical protein
MATSPRNLSIVKLITDYLDSAVSIVTMKDVAPTALLINPGKQRTHLRQSKRQSLMNQSKDRSYCSSAEQLWKMKMILTDRWSEVWSTASIRHHDEEQFAHTKPRKEKPEDKYHRFSTESGFSSRNRTSN